MSNVWLISDTHWNHKNIVKATSDWSDTSRCRDFPSIEEHNEYILNEINKVVKPEDTLYHLGDVGFGFKWKDEIKKFRARINCQKINLLVGNHDHLVECGKYKDIEALFNRIDKLWYGKVGDCENQGRSMVFCHYRMTIWPWQHQNSIHCFGHSHGNFPDDRESLSLDVGVDTEWYGHKKYTPYSLSEIFHIMDTYKKFKPLDHHTEKTN